MGRFSKVYMDKEVPYSTEHCHKLIEILSLLSRSIGKSTQCPGVIFGV